MLAKETGEVNEVYNAIRTVINNCIVMDAFDIDKCATFDLEWLFIKIRSVSVGNIINFKVVDSDDGIEYKLSLDLNDVEMKMPDENHNNKIELDGGIGLMMKYPTPAVSEKIKNLEDITEITYELIKACIDAVFDEDDVYAWDQESKVEQDTFLEMLPVEHYKTIGKFFDNMPKIEHVVNYTNSNNKNKKVVFRNLNDFFILG